MNFYSTGDLKKKILADGIAIRSVWGSGAMMTFFELAPGAVIPVHAHAHEQITYVLEGELEFTVAGETRILKPGDGVVISANEEHHVKVLGKPARAIDAWSPMRDDYKIE